MVISTSILQIIIEKRKNIPRDIFLIILEYSVERMSNTLLNYIPKCVVLMQKYHMDKEFFKLHRSTPFWFIIEQKCMDPVKSLEILSTCKCCKRHQINKPTKMEYYFSSSPVNHTSPEHREILNHFICSCPCRNYARWITRIFVEPPEAPYIEEITDDTPTIFGGLF